MHSMRPWRRSALPCRTVRAASPMRWPAARRLPSLPLCVRRSKCWPRAWIRCRLNDSAPCCGRPSCSLQRPNPAQRHASTCCCERKVRTKPIWPIGSPPPDELQLRTVSAPPPLCSAYMARCERSRTCAATIRSVAGSPCGSRHSTRGPGRFGTVGRAWSIKRRSASANSWANSRRPMRCSARSLAGRRNGSCGARRMTRRFKRKPAFRPSG